MNAQQQWYLQAMGIDTFTPREQAVTTETAPIKPVNQVKQHHQKNPTDSGQNWQSLQAQVSQCQACELHCTRTQTVFGVGNQQSDLLIVGEAPGQQEDLKGEPFVGRAGQLLDKMLHAIGLNRDYIYIANILKCRPPNNRDPKPAEQNTCTPFLLQQIELLQPKLIVTVGRIAAQYLLNSKQSLGRLRGQIHEYGEQNIPLLVTYHPAYLLRNPRDKAKAYEDLIDIKEFIG